MALLLLAAHGIIIIWTMAIGKWPLQHYQPFFHLHIWSYGGINMMCMLFVLALMLTLYRVLTGGYLVRCGVVENKIGTSDF